jgi:hypothetical protein
MRGKCVKKIIITILGILLVAVVVPWVWSHVVPNTWRYRLTVEIETPEGLKSGSSVRQINVYTRHGTERAFFYVEYLGQYLGTALAVAEAGLWLQFKKPAFIGEAVVVDLGERGIVFALVDWDSDKEFYYAFPVPKSLQGMEKIGYYNALKPGTKAELKDDLPKMVMFTDMDDPKSVKLVYVNETYANGSKKEDHFEELLGEGVRLKSVTVEITKDPVTEEIGRYLGKRHAVGPYEFKIKRGE